MIFVLIRLYINCLFCSLLCDNYKLYKQIQDNDDKLGKLCIFNSYFLGGIISINSYFLFYNIKYYLN